MFQKVPFLNPNPLNQWSRPKNIAQVQIDGENSWALLDSGSTINVVTPEFVDVCSLDVGPLSDLSDGTLGLNGFQRSILLALGLHYHKGSGGRSLGLWQRSSSPSHTGLYGIQVLSTSYAGYTHHQSDHQHDQGKWNWWVVSFPEWVEDSPIVSLLISRTSDSEGNCYKPSCGSNWLEWGGQNNKEGRSGCFFIPNNKWPNENPAPGKQHGCNGSIPERG